MLIDSSMQNVQTVAFVDVSICQESLFAKLQQVFGVREQKESIGEKTMLDKLLDLYDKLCDITEALAKLAFMILVVGALLRLNGCH
jgi:hypothetical protein